MSSTEISRKQLAVLATGTLLVIGFVTASNGQVPAQRLEKMPAGVNAGHSWRASELIGLSVHNIGDEEKGKIKDLVIGPDGRVDYAAVSFGGFLGIGDKLFAVPMDAIHLEWKDNKISRARVDVTEESIKQRQGFDDEIQLRVANAPTGLRVEGGYVVAGLPIKETPQNRNSRGVLILTAEPGASFDSLDLTVEGVAKLADGSTIVRKAEGPGMIVNVAGASEQGAVDRQRSARSRHSLSSGCACRSRPARGLAPAAPVPRVRTRPRALPPAARSALCRSGLGRCRVPRPRGCGNSRRVLRNCRPSSPCTGVRSRARPRSVSSRAPAR
jgi:hypothetical protein